MDGGWSGVIFQHFLSFFAFEFERGGKNFIHGMEIEFMRERFDDNIFLGEGGGENLEYKIHPLFCDPDPRRGSGIHPLI